MPKFHSMQFPITVKRNKITFSSGTRTIAANVTTFILCPEQGGEANSDVNTNELDPRAGYLVTRPGIIGNLIVRSESPPGAGETYTYTIRVNGVPTAITAVISGGVDRSASDLVNTVQVDIGDSVACQCVTSLNATTGDHIGSIYIDMNMVRAVYDHLTFSTGGVPTTLNRWLGSIFQYGAGGRLATAETDPTAIYTVPRKGTIKNMVALLTVAPGAGKTVTHTLRVNAVNSLLTVIISDAETKQIDTTNVVQVDAGDLLTVNRVSAGGAASSASKASFDFEEGDIRTGW